jgi:general secretion pathway protein A
MYLEFHGLSEPPFSITPDPRFVFLSERHRDALAHLLYGVGQGGGGGFVQLTGEVGTGKTTLSRLLLEQLPENTRVALVLNPRLSPVELLETIAEELKLDATPVRGSIKGLVDLLSHYLLDAYAQGLRVVLVLDEAQNLSADALEQVRLLTNLETPTQKLLQIILLGQPELREKLARPELRQLAQRITARYHLQPLDEAETDAYLRHRIAVAGGKRFPFTRLGVRALHRASGGVPRLVNIIADRALLAGYVADEPQVGESLVVHAADEVLDRPRRTRRRLATALAGAAVALAAFGAWQWWPRAEAPPPVVAAPPTAADTAPAPRSEPLATALAGVPEGAELAAWTHLLALWSVDPQQVAVRDAARCPAIVTPGLACLRGGGNLAKLDALDRPALLALRDGERALLGLLLGIDGDRVAIDLGSRTVTVPRADLESHWLGEYLALWRMPITLDDSIRRGAIGAPVAWLQRQLALFDTLPAAVDGPPLYDAALDARVRRVQSQFGLLPDGIVGPETQLVLTSRDPGGPRLARQLP